MLHGLCAWIYNGVILAVRLFLSFQYKGLLKTINYFYLTCQYSSCSCNLCGSQPLQQQVRIQWPKYSVSCSLTDPCSKISACLFFHLPVFFRDVSSLDFSQGQIMCGRRLGCSNIHLPIPSELEPIYSGISEAATTSAEQSSQSFL